MPSLDGTRVALLEARRSGELSELVRRFGGEPYAVPAVREVPQLGDLPSFLDTLAAGRFSMVICLTGSAVSRLLVEAQGLDRLDETVEALRRAVTVCRGPKPAAVLRQYGVDVSIRTAEPHTTSQVLDAISAIELDRRSIAVLQYGERSEPLVEALRGRGAQVSELCVYEWQLPADVTPLEALVEDLIGGRVGAIAFTSQIQCRHLFGIAAVMGREAALAEALRSRVIVAAIGPVCVAALAAYGVTPHVVPAQAKMGFLITELAEYVTPPGDGARRAP